MKTHSQLLPEVFSATSFNGSAPQLYYPAFHYLAGLGNIRQEAHCYCNLLGRLLKLISHPSRSTTISGILLGRLISQETSRRSFIRQKRYNRNTDCLMV
uniref:Uncharacterized protein n=1 Tax=Lutzomyia longipalpis TaxID=7200 RepID=A0A1B0CAV4_LUTLO